LEPPESDLLRLAGCADRSFLGEEVCSVGQHAVQNYGKLVRASATFALRMPVRAARRIPQLFKAEPFTGRVRMTLAAS
jgi:hypothetical protein